jgi:hypothetical protein
MTMANYNVYNAPTIVWIVQITQEYALLVIKIQYIKDRPQNLHKVAPAKIIIILMAAKLSVNHVIILAWGAIFQMPKIVVCNVMRVNS